MAGEYKKLYPPVIEGTLPAFSGTELSVPFSMNRAVSDTEVYGFIVKIKNVYNSNPVVRELKCKINVAEGIPAAARFDISDVIDNFLPGEYYKIQMAYLWKNPSSPDDDTYVGYYSTVGVIKYTTTPTIIIPNMDEIGINAYNYTYTGYYSQEGKDTTERVYKYKFDLLNSNYQLIATSDWKLHNAAQDNVVYESINTYQFNQELEMNRIYYVVYSVETTNGMIVSSQKYKVMQSLSINPEIKAHLVPKMNKDNGYVELFLQGEINEETGIEDAVTGMFKIVRSSSLDNFTTWDEVLKFSLYGQQPSRSLWKDFTVQQGITYKYALQQYNEQLLTSNRIESISVIADFEDMFLYDGKRQLKVRFNPKVTSFKNTLLESKVDTIGGKYPFIFRNGNVKYKEFPLSGLISYHADEEKLFMNYNLETIDTNLTTENIAVERDFKLEVLEWLTNGQPKLFRSPSEGNYIVRLMNTSLAPTDAVGRMLHTFSATAYEIDDYNYDILNKYGFVNAEEPSTQQIRWETRPLISSIDNLLDYVAVGLDIHGAAPGTMIYIDDGLVHEGSGYATGFEVTIGGTGAYHLDIDNNLKIVCVRVLGDNDKYDNYRLSNILGTLTYAYYSKLLNQFDLISSVIAEEIPLHQFIGEHNIIAEVNDVKNEIQAFYYLHFRKREIKKAYFKDGNYYQSINTDPITLDITAIYEVYDENENLLYLLDAKTNKQITKIDYSIYINQSLMDLEDTLEYTTYTITDITSLTIGTGIIAECAYQKQIKTFSLEINDTELVILKEGNEADWKAGLAESRIWGYEELEADIRELIYEYWDQYGDVNVFDGEGNPLTLQQRNQQLASLYRMYNTQYTKYIELLEQKIKEKEKVQGDEV